MGITASVRQTRRPIAGSTIGFRIIAVRSNSAKYNRRTGQYTTSYHPSYRIYETGDFSFPPNEREIKRFEDHLKTWHKVTNLEWE